MKTVTVERNLMTAFVNSTQHFGKGLRATPDARLDDGLADLCFLEGGATRGWIFPPPPFSGRVFVKV